MDQQQLLMQYLILIGAMAVVGLLAGLAATFLIWKDNRPIGVGGDIGVAIVTAIIVGLLDWIIIPQMGFSDRMKILGIIFEPPLAALAVLWIIRVAKKQ